MKQNCIILSLILLSLLGCEKNKYDINVINDPALVMELQSSQDTIEVGNNSIYLTSFTWRDFMPSTYKFSSLLICTANVTDKNNVSLPSNNDILKIWVINGDKMWIKKVTEIRNKK